MRTEMSCTLIVITCAVLVPAMSYAGPDTLWTRTYDPNGTGGYGLPSKLVADTSGIYVFGAYCIPGVSAVTVKYTNTAELAWSRHRTGGYTISPIDICAHPAGGVVAVGKVSQDLDSWEEIDVTRCLPDGTVEWGNTYTDDSFSLVAASAVVDNAGNTLVAGAYAERYVSHDFDFLLLKLNPSGGVAWLSTYEGPDSTSYENGVAVAVDSTGNGYVAGERHELHRKVARLVKFNADGDTMWSRSYASPDTETSWPVAVAVGPSGDIVMLVTGSMGTSNPYMALSTYSATGAERWSHHWRSPDGRPSNAVALTTDNSGCIYVTGQVLLGPTSNDVVTVKYTPDGDTVWSAWYVGEKREIPLDMTLAHDGSFYVCGSGVDSADETNLMMLRFAADGAFLWKHLLGYGKSTAVVVSPTGQVLAAAQRRPVPGADPEFCLVGYTETGEPHDVGCSHIVAPTGRIDSGSVVVPVCSVYNYGTLVESYAVRMRIGTGYEQAAQVSDHSPQTRREVRFPAWTVGPPGSYAVVCSTECASDPHPENDARRTAVEVGPPAVGEAGLTPGVGPGPLRHTLHGATVRIAFSLDRATVVRLTVIDAVGRTVRSLANARMQPGRHEVIWDRTDESARPVQAGVYYLSLIGKGQPVTDKVVLFE